MAVAIVLSAGSGKRMNSNVAKQYMTIFDKEVIYYSLKVFNDNDAISRIILVVKEGEEEFCKHNIVEKYSLDKVTTICKGGKERYNSVYNGLCQIKDDDEIVLVHDGARPFVTDEMILNSIFAAKEYGACTVGMPVKDTIKIIDDEMMGVDTPDRKYLYQIQTPQSFKVSVLKSAYEKMFVEENHNITDDSMLVEQYNGVKSKIILGDYTNIKITTPEDIEVAEIFAKKNKKNIKKDVDKQN